MADEAAFAAQRVFEPYLRDRGFVNGRWIEAQDGRRFEVTDPSSGRAIVSVPRMGAAETRAAIAAAEAALPGWRDSTAGARAKVLKRWAFGLGWGTMLAVYGPDGDPLIKRLIDVGILPRPVPYPDAWREPSPVCQAVGEMGRR